MPSKSRSSRKFQTPPGMHDILLDQMRWHEYVRSTAKTIAEAYGFAHIATPVLEDAELFSRGLGAATDIVEKELFTLKTKGGDFLALRPEGTAPIARAYIQQGMKSLPQPVKLFYYNPMFRHDRPQRGRLREFWQFCWRRVLVSNRERIPQRRDQRPQPTQTPPRITMDCNG